MRGPAGPLLLAGLLGAGALVTSGIWAPGRDVYVVVGVSVALVLAALPGTRRLALWGMEALGRAKPWAVACALYVLALLELGHAATLGNPYHGPKLYDEQSYVLGTLMMAAGRVAAPMPEAPESFESFEVQTRPAYGSVYAPGTALLHAPAVWAGVPPWWLSVAISAGLAPAVYLALRPALGGGLAPFAGLLVLGATQVRAYQATVMSHVPVAVIGALLLAAAQVYGRRGTWKSAAGVGALSGLLIITRPQDAACYLPGALLLSMPSVRPLRFPRAGHFAVVVLAAAPFLALCAAQNVAMTGSVLRTPFYRYTVESMPVVGWGPRVTAEPAEPPRSQLRQKHDFQNVYLAGVRKVWREQFWRGVVQLRVALAMSCDYPTIGLAALFPLGMVGLCRSRAGVAALLTVALFGAVYGPYTFFLPHYALTVMAGMVGAVFAVPLAVEALVPALGATARAAIALSSVALLLAVLPETNPAAVDPGLRAPTLQLCDRAEAAIQKRPAILLFEYGTGMSYAEEPVYNLKSWRIDDHQVIRAHDLGPLNQALFEAYARKTPLREVYRFNYATGQLVDLGRVGELAVK